MPGSEMPHLLSVAPPVIASIAPIWLTWATGALLLGLVGAMALIWLLRRRLKSQARLLQAFGRDRDLVLRSISDNVTFLDRDMRVVWTNWAERDSRGGARRPVTGGVCHVAIAGCNTPCAGCPVPEVLRSGIPAEGVIDCRDGAVLRMSAAPVRDERGEVVGVVQTTRDITEKRRLAERLQRSQKLEAVGQLAAGVAHDFNNSLQAILGYADLLASLLPPESDAQSYVKAMNRAGQQAREVVRQLVTFSRKREPCTELLDLGDWLRGQADILRRLLDRGIEVRVAVAPDLPKVCADAAQIEQALLNLCTNARDAMPGGGRLDLALEAVTLSASDTRQLGAPAAGVFVVLSVTDQGEGIAPELQDRIFDPFFTTKDVDRGTGLGLATVYGIVSAHRGFVELRSQPGRGATFRLGLPAAGEAAAAGRAAQPAGRVLVVEEEPAVRQLAVTVLQREGYDVDEAPDGPSALLRLLEFGARYDVVVVEAMLGGLNGWSLYRQARRRLPDLRAVFCSSHDPESLEAELPGVKPELAYLRKPYRARELADKVAGLLAARDGERVL